MSRAEATAAESRTDAGTREQRRGPSTSAPERWIERLKAAVGLKSAGSIREDLAEALAADDADGGFSPEERAMLANILRLRDVRVDDVMVPRADIDAVEIGISLGDLLARLPEVRPLAHAGLSRDARRPGRLRPHQGPHGPRHRGRAMRAGAGRQRRRIAGRVST